jgi:UDP-glucose 4-epimerase
VRYGNVIASRGSVIPLFLDQARKKMALTITNPNMTRYLMSLKDSVDLVQYAFEHANSGEVCIQKAPGASISDLAAAVNNITGNDVLTTNIGARHGEKMDEVLLSAEEATKAVDYGTFFRIPPDERDLNYNKYFIEGNHSLIKEPYTSRNTNQLTILEIEALIRKNFNLEDTSGE